MERNTNRKHIAVLKSPMKKKWKKAKPILDLDGDGTKRIHETSR